MEKQRVEVKYNEHETELLKAKLEFLQMWTVVFYNEEHRSVMSYLCYKMEKGTEKVDSLVDPHLFKIVNIENILAQLRNGFLVNIEEAKNEKKEKKTLVSVNLHFFSNYQNIVQVITEDIKPQLELLKQNLKGQLRKKCLNCGVQRPQSQLSFFGTKCDCTNPNFVTVEVNKNKKQRLDFLMSVLNKQFFKQKQKIDYLEKEVIQTKRKTKEENNKDPNPFEQFCKENNFPKITEQQLISVKQIQRERATNLYGRKLKIKFREELLQTRENRKKKMERELYEFNLMS